jgi:hypothetical protein
LYNLQKHAFFLVLLLFTFLYKYNKMKSMQKIRTAPEIWQFNALRAKLYGAEK